MPFAVIVVPLVAWSALESSLASLVLLLVVCAGTKCMVPATTNPASSSVWPASAAGLKEGEIVPPATILPPTYTFWVVLMFPPASIEPPVTIPSPVIVVVVVVWRALSSSAALRLVDPPVATRVSAVIVPSASISPLDLSEVALRCPRTVT